MLMLTPEQIAQNKIEYLTLVASLGIDITNLAYYLDQVGYFEAPASTQTYKAYAGGLCEHALNVCNELRQLVPAYTNKYTIEDVIKIALFKDIYKAELYESFERNVKDEETGKWTSVVSYRNKATRPAFGDLGFSSYMIAKRFIDLTDEQIEAICYQSLGIENGFKSKDIYEVLRQYPLVSLTHMADIAASYLTE